MALGGRFSRSRGGLRSGLEAVFGFCFRRGHVLSPSVKAPCLGLALAASIIFAAPAQAQVNVMVNFTGHSGSAPGAVPKGSMILSGSTLFGFTSTGGSNDYGVIFSVNTDGSGYNVVHHFSGPSNTDGNTPHHGYLTLLDDTIIRPMLNGGASGQGTIFSVTTSGSNQTPVYTFTGSSAAPTSLGDGAQPHSGMLAGAGGTYYGMTAAGGAHGGGVLYSFSASTGAVTSLYSFDPTTGSNSHGQLIWDSTGTKLLGMTRQGGTGTGNSNTSNEPPGTIFSFNPQTSEYTTLFNFNAAVADSPYYTDHGILTLGTGTNSTTVFGMTEFGGTNDDGAIFAISETGGSITTLHSFSGSSDNGKHPFGSLTLGPNGLLYGMTRDGGTSDDGVIFSIAQDGTGFTLLASLDNTTGINPIDNLTFSADGLTLYGLTQNGGTDNQGTIFSLAIPEPSASTLCALGAVATGLAALRRRRR